MLQINDLRLPVDAAPEALERKLEKLLGLPRGGCGPIRIVRQSIDARDKSRIQMVYSLRLEVPGEERILRRGLKNVKRVERREYTFPPVHRSSANMPVVAGMGPAGLFCALYLARNGIPCVVLERGRSVERRAEDVARFWETGILDPASNVQFGEGGAGTFSDGKLTTGTHDPRIGTVLETLHGHGAPEDTLYAHKPHIGTDILRRVVRSIRLELLRLGCDVRFESQLVGLRAEGDRLRGVTVRGPSGEYILETDTLVLAIGHSARDTFQMLYDAGLPLEPKPFAIGVRIEHPQAAISRAQFGDVWEKLPPSDYKLSCHLPSGRSAYTFCVCPGGQVVASASAPGELVTNGMSFRARDGENINGGFLVGVTPADFPGADPLAGVRFQRQWERLAFQLGGGNFRAPAQRVGDFLARRPSTGGGGVAPTYRPGVTWGSLEDCLPGYVTAALRDALPIFDRKVRGFADSDAVLTGVETRSSSPVRLRRDATLQTALRGVYPCGEGCGYAGGIVSAAVDGVRVAEAVAGLDCINFL
ncbi:MAG: hypothetical protein IJ751_09930 [Oscillospiraceae bacterium]|nr:hypothetical protein [Oscillospiraceae bacterium]